ncbi:protocadherin gamma-B4-like, partial [Plectropomus leopardus]|uniref:protocadherin gamma-B4-like n=1 Tax=Plectropomus leopardus TaxID=160734 RepID=UPI001C4B01C8
HCHTKTFNFLLSNKFHPSLLSLLTPYPPTLSPFPPEVSEATATLGPGTMGLSTRYSPQFTLQHVPDYRQNVYIPGSTATLTSNPQQQQATAQQASQQALPPPQASVQPEPPKAAQTPASKKKSTKKEKK